jgi:hypothetical protein
VEENIVYLLLHDQELMISAITAQRGVTWRDAVVLHQGVESAVNTTVQTTTPLFAMENKRLNAQTAMGTIGWTTVAVQLKQEQ